MKKIEVPLNMDFTRPTIGIFNNKYNALVDTGATIPVAYLPLEYMDVLCEKGKSKLITKNVNVVGVDPEHNYSGRIYSLSYISIGELKYNNIEVFVPNKITSIPEQPFLLSATMFHKLEYDIDNIHNKFKIIIPSSVPLIRDFKIIKVDDKLIPRVDGELVPNLPKKAEINNVDINELSEALDDDFNDLEL